MALSDRQQDCVEPLLAIADAAGGKWPEQTRRALLEILTSAPAEDLSNRVKLLADIRDVFDERSADRLLSRDLIEALAAIETSPWAEFNRGKPVTPVGLSRLLAPFEIFPKTIRIESSTGKGHSRDSFEDSWRRYLGPSSVGVTRSVLCPETSQPSQSSNNAAKSTFSGPSQGAAVTAPEIANVPVLTRVVTDVSPQTWPEREEHAVEVGFNFVKPSSATAATAAPAATHANMQVPHAADRQLVAERPSTPSAAAGDCVNGGSPQVPQMPQTKSQLRSKRR